MYNAKGEHITKNFCQHRETDISSKAIREWYIQNTTGNGPVHLDFGDEPQVNLELLWDRPYGKKFRVLNDETGATFDPELEVCPMLIGEQSPMKVDREYRATIDGLYAVGDCSYCGSGLAGAVPAPPGRNRGSGILNAVFAGIVGGEAAAEYVKTVSMGKVDDAVVAQMKADAFAPLLREEGIDPIEVIDDVQNIMCPVENSIYMSQHRLDVCLRKLEKVKAKVNKMKANDLHGMLSCHEAEAMVLCCEMQMKAATMRKESRGWFLREDFPLMDNENWLKWIIVKNEDGEMKLSTEDVPIEKYPVQVPKF
jgi:succinate dehydrogenase/fumarate reductase flavoprotein subunit